MPKWARQSAEPGGDDTNFKFGVCFVFNNIRKAGNMGETADISSGENGEFSHFFVQKVFCVCVCMYVYVGFR